MEVGANFEEIITCRWILERKSHCRRNSPWYSFAQATVPPKRPTFFFYRHFFHASFDSTVILADPPGWKNFDGIRYPIGMHRKKRSSPTAMSQSRTLSLRWFYIRLFSAKNNNLYCVCESRRKINYSKLSICLYHYFIFLSSAIKSYFRQKFVMIDLQELSAREKFFIGKDKNGYNARNSYWRRAKAFRMLNAEFWRERKKQLPLCYRPTCTKARGNIRAERDALESNGNLRIVSEGVQKKNEKNEARTYGTWTNAATATHEDLLEYPLRVKGPFPFSFYLARTNVVINPPAHSTSFPSLGACKQNHPLKEESISRQARRRSERREPQWKMRTQRHDWTWRFSSIINISVDALVKNWWNSRMLSRCGKRLSIWRILRELFVSRKKNLNKFLIFGDLWG